MSISAADGASDRGLGHAQLGQELALAVGGSAAVRAHGRDDERLKAQAADRLGHGADDPGKPGDSPAAHGDGDPSPGEHACRPGGWCGSPGRPRRRRRRLRAEQSCGGRGRSVGGSSMVCQFRSAGRGACDLRIAIIPHAGFERPKPREAASCCGRPGQFACSILRPWLGRSVPGGRD